jgi:hypothetical protein
LTPDAESDFVVRTPAPNSAYFRPESPPLEGREVIFARSQLVVMGTHPEIPNVVIIGRLGYDLPEDYVAPALSHEEIHNAMNKLGESEKSASSAFLDQIGSAVTQLDSSGLASEFVMESIFDDFRSWKKVKHAH